jgi:hypothetical protein
MGPKGACSYFQQMMQIVLAGLLYIICEVYLDDILVWGASEEEFFENLERVFKRFVEYNLTVSPEKCYLGLSKVEYVGLLLDDQGYTFTQDKRETVLNMALPQTQKQLKSFMGMCNYFNTHIKGYALIARPLQGLMVPYKPSLKIVWTEEQIQVFEQLKAAVHNCQKLFFLDPNQGEIHVKTDASLWN